MAASIFMALNESNANIGFAGGTYVDYHPECGINECVQRITYECNLNLVECADIKIGLNSEVSYALTESVHYGTTPDLKELINEAEEGIGDKIKNLWKKLKEWIASIIAKFSTWLNSSKGRQEFITKNEEKFKANMKLDSVKSQKIKGFPFAVLKGEANINTDNFRIPDDRDWENADAAKTAIQNKAKEIFGLKTDGDAKTELRNKLYGAEEAADIALSEFNPDAIIKELKNAEGIKKAEAAYRDASGKIDKEERDAAAQGGEEGRKKAEVVRAALAAWNELQAIGIAASRAANQQAWKIFNTAVNSSSSDAKSDENKTEENKANENKTEENKSNEGGES